MRWIKKTLPLLCLLIAHTLGASPQVQSVFPSTSYLLGQTKDWTIVVHHPFWEIYRLQLNPLAGVEMQLVGDSTAESGGELQTTFVVRMTPVLLTAPEAPTVLLIDAHGHPTVLQGQPLEVHAISGDSLEIKAPETPRFLEPEKRSKLMPAIIIAGVIATILLGWILFRRRTPRNKLRRSLRRMLSRIRTEGVEDPAGLLDLLRSPMLWGFDAAPLTAVELREKELADPNLKTLVAGIARLEEDRYSADQRKPSRTAAEASLAAALAVVGRR